jgi:CheY-like chemotaxis protein
MVIERKRSSSGLQLARVLLADDDPAARLAVQTVLEAGGYRVDSAASAAEAVGKLDEKEYELVLTDIDMEFPDSGLKVIAHARMMDYKPATAVLRTESNAEASTPTDRSRAMLVGAENLPEFLAQVASLISVRATRKLARQMRQQAVFS